MAQVKKKEVREAILNSAKKNFSSVGYNRTTMNSIAKNAHVSTSNLYNYFDSKMDILFAIYGPWLSDQLKKLDKEIKSIKPPKERLKKILMYLWITIPEADSGFANNLNQALSSRSSQSHYNRSLLLWAEAKLSGLLETCIRQECKKYLEDDLISHMIFKSFDGFVMSKHLDDPNGLTYRLDRVDQISDMMIDLLVEPEK